MSIFNDNLRFVCKKMGLSQQRLADLMGIKRGKVAGYFYETQAKPDFYEKLGEKFNLDIGKFLTVGMSNENYNSFFKSNILDFSVAEDQGEYQRKSDLIDILMLIKKSDDKEEISRLLDEAISLYGKVLDENSKLKDINSELKDQLLKMVKKSGDN